MEDYFFSTEEQSGKEKKAYVLIIYDIVDNSRRTKLAKFLQGYGFRVQKSAFEALISHSLYTKLLREIEKFVTKEDSIRIYKAAHTIVSITNEKIVKWTDYTAEELLVKIQQLTLFVVPGQDGSIWDSYDRMNEAIMKEIRQEILK